MSEPTIKVQAGKDVDLPLLLAELRAADIGIDSIGGRGDELIAYDADGKPIAWSAEAVVIVEAHRPPAPELTRDERLLAAVDSAKTAVAESKVFTAEQAAVLSAMFDGLGKAITGEAP